MEEISVEEDSSFEIQNEETADLLTEIEPDNFEETVIDLSDAVIDEPDISSQIIENPLLEPSPGALDEYSGEFEMNDEPAEAVSPVSFENFTEDRIEQVIPEGFIVDTGDEQVSFDDDLEIDEVGELDDIELAPLDEIVTDHAGVLHETSVKITDSEVNLPGEESGIPNSLKGELKIVLSYMDQLLESLPEEKIEEFARSEYFDTYKKLFKELGLA
jgi:hypothetical protein